MVYIGFPGFVCRVLNARFSVEITNIKISSICFDCRESTGLVVYIVVFGFVCRVLNANFFVEITGKENIEHTQTVIIALSYRSARAPQGLRTGSARPKYYRAPQSLRTETNIKDVGSFVARSSLTEF